MFDWDDLRVFLAAARAGSFGAAGQRLGVDTATVGRRVGRLESALKSTLLVRSRTGLQVTAAGAQLAEIATEAESWMSAAERVAEPDIVAGTVRISASEGFGASVLAPALPGLLAERPALRIELAAHAGFFSPSRREVDMAITLSPPQPHRLVIEPLTDYELGLFASAEYLAKAGMPETVADLPQFRIVGYVDDLLYASELRYLDEVLPGLKPSLASSSIQAQRSMLLNGGGIGVLPLFLSGGLQRVLPTSVSIQRRFWVSTHQDVHGTARMRAVASWLKQLVARNRDRIAPEAALEGDG